MMLETKGLTQKEANEKLKEYGFNEIRELAHKSLLRILLRQVKKNFIIYLLLVAMIISFFVGKLFTGYVILGVIIVVVFVGFVQEYRAERAINSLKQMIMPISIVIRDGKEKEIPSKEIVPGDIIVLRSGEKVPADCVVLEQKDLKVNETVLTGESKEITKLVVRDFKNYTNENVLFMGTFVVNGRSLAQVIHTGMNTQFGKIAGMISTAEKELPLQANVNDIAKYMAFIAIFVSVLTGLIMFIRGLPFSYGLLIDVLIVVIALSVSAIPEGFPVVLITTLASGAYRMAKKNAIVNRMSIIETLGETTIICTDKTGTITKGEMTVKKIFSEDRLIDVGGAGYEATGNFLYTGKELVISKDSNLNLLFKTAVICNDSKIERTGTDKGYNVIGSPTESALLIMATKANLFREDLKFTRIEEIPFNSDRKLMSVLSEENGENYVYVKGAPEILLKKCKFIYKNKKLAELDGHEKQKILDINKGLTLGSYRSLALAYKKTKSSDKTGFEENLVFLGIVGLEDPPREEIKETLELCKTAGIKVKMVTGDNKNTALAIAKQIGFEGGVLEGEEIDKLTDDEFMQVVKDVVIFARVKPEHKLRIVKALKQNGEIVTMTGDGVNDAPALKEAHIGVAMGKNGTDVSRDAADLTLKDDNFSTIVSAISEGRTVFNNIRKFLTYQLSCNYAELMIIFVAIVIGFPLPLLALQILFMNLVTDDLPAITLGFNPPSKDVMKSKPRRKAHLFNKKMFILLLIAGTVMAVITLGVFYFVLEILNKELIVARTVALVTLIFLEIANAFNFRSFRSGVHELPLLANKYLIYASILSIFATVLIIYTPLNKAFETAPIGITYWLFALVISFVVIFVFDILKLITRKRGGLLPRKHFASKQNVSGPNKAFSSQKV